MADGGRGDVRVRLVGGGRGGAVDECVGVGWRVKGAKCLVVWRGDIRCVREGVKIRMGG